MRSISRETDNFLALCDNHFSNAERKLQALTIIATSIPLLLAATGELITEKSGVLNLGVEGMMLSGAVGALGAVLWLGNPYFGIVAGALSGIFMASIFSIFTINFMTNQVATGLGLTIFATGLTGLAGAPLVGKTVLSLPKIEIFLLSDIPFVGEILFKQDFIAYLSIAIIIFITYYLFHFFFVIFIFISSLFAFK